MLFSRLLRSSRTNVFSFVGWARFFAHVLTDRPAWAKKRAHPTVTTKEVAFYLRSFAFICGLNAFKVFDSPKSIGLSHSGTFPNGLLCGAGSS